MERLTALALHQASSPVPLGAQRFSERIDPNTMTGAFSATSQTLVVSQASKISDASHSAPSRVSELHRQKREGRSPRACSKRTKPCQHVAYSCLEERMAGKPSRD